MHASPFSTHLMPHCFGSQRHTLAPPRMGISHQKFCQTNSDDPPRRTSANHALGSSSRNIKMAWVFPFVQGAPKHMVHPPETRPMSPHFKPPHCQTPPTARPSCEKFCSCLITQCDLHCEAPAQILNLTPILALNTALTLKGLTLTWRMTPPLPAAHPRPHPHPFI